MPSMLEDGPCPEQLKMRISGGGGHLSNEQSAEVVRRSVHSRMKWIASSHLSEENNTPETADDTIPDSRQVATICRLFL